MTSDKIRLNVTVSSEARDKLGKHPSRAIEDLAMRKIETLEGIRESFQVLHDEVMELKRIHSESSQEVKNMSDYLSEVSRGAY